MGRIRTIKPEFFRSRSLARCSIAARITFQGLWCEADDHGRGIADPRIIRGVVWPLEESITSAMVGGHLSELAETGHIRLYTVEGERYYEISKWEKHQAASHRRGAAVHPLPPAETADPDDLHSDACDEMQDRAGTGNWELGTGSASDDASPPPAPTPIPRRRARPEDWEPSQTHRSMAAREGLNLAREASQFKDHHDAKRSLFVDWDKAFNTWLRNARGFGAPTEQPDKVVYR